MGEQALGPGLIQGVLIPFGGMLLIFYFIVFRPQMKAQKDHEKMLKALKKNDEVVTRGGAFGTVVNVKADRVTLRLDENVRVDYERDAITRVLKTRAGEPHNGRTEETSR